MMNTKQGLINELKDMQVLFDKGYMTFEEFHIIKNRIEIEMEELV